MSTHNIGFYEEISKIITVIIKYNVSSNTHLISSAARPRKEGILCYLKDCFPFLLKMYVVGPQHIMWEHR